MEWNALRAEVETGSGRVSTGVQGETPGQWEELGPQVLYLLSFTHNSELHSGTNEVSLALGGRKEEGE